MRIILASQSRTRKEAMDLLNIDYEVIPSNFDEKSIRHEDPKELARLLSEAKAKEVGKNNNDAIIVSGDLFAVHNGKIMEKPKDLDEAREMLGSLSGNTFEVISSVSVYNVSENKMLSDVTVCNTTLRKLTEKDIEDYIKNNEVTKFAAAFDNIGVYLFVEKTENYPIILILKLKQNFK